MIHQRRSPKSFLGIVEYVLGFSCLFPSIAIFNLGSSTGVQFSMILATIATIFHVKNRNNIVGAWITGVIPLLFVVFICQLAEFSANDLLIKNFIAFQVCLICIVLGSMMSALTHSIERYIAGYMAGSIISSCFAIIQFVGWKVLGSSSDLLLGFRNNKGFGDLEAEGYINFTDYGRSFAFCSEPSVLALLLMPGFIYSVGAGRYKTSLLIGCALLTTQSVTSIVLLLPIFTYFCWKRGEKVISSRTLVAFLVTLPLVFGASLYIPEFSNRLRDLTVDGSTISRLNSLISGWQAVQVHPLLGWGIQSDDLNSFVEDRSTIFEVSKNIQSLLLSLMAWFGVPTAMVLLFPLVRFFMRRHTSYSPATDAFMAATLIPTLLSLNYFTLYNVWICLGIACSFGLRRRRLKANNFAGTPLNLSSSISELA